ncbi:hypothetical protein [Vibrio algivorus]|uniref:HEAT repeat domain-containing protein n=1 Tax=Vibrio algivorus TaxID=1667024 RepID=A0ABQ6ESK3_9VIBR|nr:hypothetical protein [Vibrio algivorus]GLT16128.1 hypothetical protein GCM10007931_31040 [Vibrio algivorus]
MRQGLSAIIFLLSIVLFGPFVQANEMTQSEVSSWLSNPNTQSSADHLYQLALQDKVPEIQMLLDEMSMPRQEVVRYLFLKKVERTRLVLSPRLAIFIQLHQTRQPHYQYSESGEGYSVTLSAFNTSLVANRLISHWKQDQTTLDFIIEAENNQLLLSSWLQGDDYQVKKKEALFVAEADSLSPQALQFLSNQLVGNSLKWLPTTPIVIKLAQLTKDERLYNLLWKMKGDDHSLKEIQRLAQKADQFSLQQVMNATQNPVIKPIALKQLTSIKPMSESVQTFLIERLNHSGDGLLVAQTLSESEHYDWLISLLESGQVSQSQALLKSIAAIK